MKKLNIAIVGLGNIGSYLYKYLNDNKKILTKKNNCLPLIRYVSAKNKKRKRNLLIKKKQFYRNQQSKLPFQITQVFQCLMHFF